MTLCALERHLPGVSLPDVLELRVLVDTDATNTSETLGQRMTASQRASDDHGPVVTDPTLDSRSPDAP